MEPQTMTGTALETVQQGYKCFGEGNIAGLIELLDDNVIWKDPGTVGNFYKDTRKGKAEVLDFFQNLPANVTLTNFNVDSITAAGETVFATGTLEGTGVPTGLPVDTDWAMVWKVENGKVVYHHLYTNTHVLGKALGV